MYIYKVTNNINGKVYIGRTKRSIEQRWKQHCRDAFHGMEYGKGKLQYAISEFGPENFTVEQIDCADTKAEADEKEVYWIKHYNTTETGYNTSPGGRNGARHKKVMNVETGKIYNSRVEACNAIGVSHNALHFVVDNPKWTCKGYHWVSVKK